MAEEYLNYDVIRANDSTISKNQHPFSSSTPSASQPDPEVFTKITGAFGLYQLLILLQMFISKFPVAFHQMAIIFLSPKTHAHFTCSTGNNSCPCDNPKFDTSLFSTSMVTEYELICSRFWLASFNQTIFQLGVLLGSVLFGMAADRYGRKKPLLVAIVMKLGGGCLSAFMPDYWTFTLLRVLTGLAVGGSMVVSYVLIMELIGTRYRHVISAVYHMPFNVGHILLGLVGYLFRDFRSFELALSITAAPCLIYFCFVPETPRWLLAATRKEHAIRVLTRMAKVNKRPTDNIRPQIDAYEAAMAKTNKAKKSTVVDLFRTPNLRKKTLIMCFIWFSCGYAFYGTSQYVGQLGGNVFINVAISGVMALIGSILTLPLMKYFGRKTIIIGFSYICAISLILLAILNNPTLKVLVAVTGVCASFISYGLAYLFCSELFPTVVRNAAVGFSSMMARAGSMLAPFVIDLQKIAVFLPPIVFAIVPLIAGTLTFLLPETKGHELSTTIEEGESFGKGAVGLRPAKK